MDLVPKIYTNLNRSLTFGDTVPVNPIEVLTRGTILARFALEIEILR